MTGKLIHKRWKLFLVLIILLLFFILRAATLVQKKEIISKKGQINQSNPLENVRKELTSVVIITPATYTLIESHRGVPRLVSMQEGQNLLTSNEYYDLLKQRIEKDNISAKIWFESKCNEFWIFDNSTDENVSIERHGYHQDGCPGDPNFAPRLDVFNINRESKEIFWLDIGKNKNIPYDEWAKTISKE